MLFTTTRRSTFLFYVSHQIFAVSFSSTPHLRSLLCELICRLSHRDATNANTKGSPERKMELHVTFRQQTPEVELVGSFDTSVTVVVNWIAKTTNNKPPPAPTMSSNDSDFEPSISPDSARPTRARPALEEGGLSLCTICTKPTKKEWLKDERYPETLCNKCGEKYIKKAPKRARSNKVDSQAEEMAPPKKLKKAESAVVVESSVNEEAAKGAEDDMITVTPRRIDAPPVLLPKLDVTHQSSPTSSIPVVNAGLNIVPAQFLPAQLLTPAPSPTDAAAPPFQDVSNQITALLGVQNQYMEALRAENTTLSHNNIAMQLEGARLINDNNALREINRRLQGRLDRYAAAARATLLGLEDEAEE